MTERQDLRFMQEALKLSERGRRLAPPNPSVGCVIVRAGEVIASGYTQRAGGHDDDRSVRGKPVQAALDVHEFLRAQVGGKARLGHGVVAQGQRGQGRVD